MNRKRRKKLDPFDPKFQFYFTLSEFSWFLRVKKETIKRWAGWINSPWKVPGFPQHYYRGHNLVWEIKDIEEWLGISLRGKRIVNPLLSIKDIMALTGKAESTVREWIKKGKLKAIRIGYKNLRVEQRELMRYLDETYDYRTIDRMKANSINFSSEKYY